MSQNPDLIPEGLPYHLPEGEHLIWQGKPQWQSLAIHAFHVRKVAAYFGVIIAAQALFKMSKGASWFEAVPVLVGLGMAACAILTAMAYASAKTTGYTLTSKRVLMKVGIAVPVIINLPFDHIDSASFATSRQNTGTIVFKTGGDARLAYLLLWPHVKPWTLSKPQPAFREIADVETVAVRLAAVLGGQVPATALQNQTITGHMVPAE